MKMHLVTNIHILLAAFMAGRIILHVMAAAKTHHVRVHLAGVAREFRRR
jgi:hypothetical protein